ncbi:FxSxx-COOH system tetratricopeptide repeat protein [Kitasatospora sp. NPDC097691]|uniref:FxSxx-COOH system tetratricopeptide repeat protein n=1 Tax=Kitasatospora sp. NPDC097691 TaxID=3157231 RepID=UPI0033222345
MHSRNDLVNSGGVVAGSMRDVHVHGTSTTAPAWPVQIGAVPAPADCYLHRPPLDGALRTGGAVVLSGPAGTGKTQAAAHHAHAALRAGTVDLVLWIDASSRAAVLDGYARAAVRLGPLAATAGVPDLLAWLNTTDRRWLLVLDGLAAYDDLAGLWPNPAPGDALVATTRSTDPRLRTLWRRVVPVRDFADWEALGYLADRLAVHGLGAPETELTAVAAAAGGRPVELCAAADRLIAAGTGPSPYPHGLRRGTVRLRRPVDCPLCGAPLGTGFDLRYAPEDGAWARWIESVLVRAGLALMRDGSPERTIVLLSPAYLRSPLSRALDEQALLTVRIDGAVPPPTSHPPAPHPKGSPVAPAAGVPTTAPAVALTGLSAEQAADSLRTALGGTPRVPDLTGLRYPGSGPAHFKAPPRHPSFTGRGAVLAHLHRQLGGGLAAVLPTSRTLYGLGGIGKTQIALEYAHRFKTQYDLVWWIDAEQPELIRPALADVARELGLQVGDSVAEAADAALAALRRGAPAASWLLVFDNAEEPADILPFLPGGPGHILVTSRNPEWSRVAEALAVNVFTREESTEHLCRRVPGLTAQQADAVAEELGDLPLAVEVAAAWLDTTAMPVDTYLAQLRNATVQVLSMGRPADYPASLAAAWNVSTPRLRAHAPGATRLLQLCAHFAPEPIAMRLLYSDPMIGALARHDPRPDGSLPDGPRPDGPLALAEAIRAIGRYSLARVDTGRGTVQLHRLVQAVVRDGMTEEERRTAAHDVHLVLASARPARGGVDDPANWPAFDDIWPHLGACSTYDCDDPEPRELLIDRVRYLWKRGELQRADDLSGTLIPRWTAKLGADHPQTLLLRFQQANVLRSQGRYREAYALDESVLERQRAVLGEHHPHTLTTAGSLGADHRVLGRFHVALTLDHDTYARSRTLFGADNPRTLTMGHNLAIGHRLVGDSQAARDLDRETLDRRTKVLGPRHPYTLTSKFCLARDLRDLGEFRASIDLLAEVVADLGTVLDPDLPENLRAATSLAVSLRRAGRLREAHAINAATHERFAQRYGEDSPDALVCAVNLAADHSAAGDDDLARALTVRLHAAHRRLFGSDHPFTLACAANLALYLRTSGDAAAAVAHGEAVVGALAERLGPRHPFTLKATINLANAHTDAGHHTAALPLLRQALDDLRTSHGEQHPDTLACTADLARTLRALDHPAEATDLHTTALVALTHHLGADHPDTRRARDRQPIDRDLETQPV